LFVDSRYTLQAPAQTDTAKVTVHEALGGLPAEIGDYVPKGGIIRYDPWLHTPGEIRDLQAKLGKRAKLVPGAQSGRRHLERPARRPGQRDRSVGA
jgi:Xaa-Pro aminopeptidase